MLAVGSLVAVVGFTTPALRAPVAALRHAAPRALDVPTLADTLGSASPLASDALDTANLLAAQIFGLDTNPYGGTSTFSQTDSGASGDLNIVLLLGFGFPTILTAFVYRENIAAIFEEPPEVEPPPGWRKVPSRSRPGKFSYENIKTKDRYDRLPPEAFK